MRKKIVHKIVLFLLGYYNVEVDEVMYQQAITAVQLRATVWNSEIKYLLLQAHFHINKLKRECTFLYGLEKF